MSSHDHKNLKTAAIAQVRVVEGILRRWDPIGVEPGTMAPADEYDSYAPHMVSMVNAGCTVDDLTAHLEELALSTIGVGSNPVRSRKFAAEIIRTVGPSNTSLERTHAR
jgi:hypothetical protein